MVSVKTPLRAGALKYQQVRVLRKGSLGSLYHVNIAVDSISGELVVLEYINRGQEGACACAEREMAHHLPLGHPHIAAIKEICLTEQHLVIVMEPGTEAGGQLASLVPPRRGLSEGRARWLLQQVAFALDYCHRMGVAVRNLTLDSILLDSQAQQPLVKLSDFALSVRAEDGTTCQDYTPCHAQYTPPEAYSRRPYDAKKYDIWQLGVLMYALLTGAYPFSRPGDSLLGRQDRLRVLAQRIQQMDYNLPHTLSFESQNLIMRMLAADPELRPSAQELLLHPWMTSRAIQGPKLLQINRALAADSLANSPPAGVLAEVHSLIQDGGELPRAKPEL